MSFRAGQLAGRRRFGIHESTGLEDAAGDNKPEGFVNADGQFHDLTSLRTDDVAGEWRGGTGHEYGDDIVAEAFSDILGGLAGEQSQRPDPLAGILQSDDLGVLETLLGKEEIGDLLDVGIDLADDGSAIEKGFNESPNPSADKAGQKDAKEVDQAYSDDEAADVQMPIIPDLFEIGDVFIDGPAEYPQPGMSDQPDNGPIDIDTDILVDELIALDDQDQAEQARKHGCQASKKEVLEITPKSFFLRLCFHG